MGTRALFRVTRWIVTLFFGLCSVLAAEPQKKRVIVLDEIEGGRPWPTWRRFPPALLVDAIRACAANASAPPPPSAMILVLTFSYGPGGNVERVLVSGSENVPPELAKCAQWRAQRLDGEPARNSLTVKQTYVLLPAPGETVHHDQPTKGAELSAASVPLLGSDFLNAAPPIVVFLDPPPDAVGLLVRDLRARIEGCEKHLGGPYRGTLGIRLLEGPDGSHEHVLLEAVPALPALTDCIEGTLAESRSPARPGEAAWQVGLSFAIDEQGVALVR
jgi:hypothetical protein